MKLFQNHRVKGAVSIFLIMILLPTMIFSAVLIDGSRLASAKAMAQEATDLAAVSALASYNQELKDNFGLFAIDDNEKVEEIYKESLTNTLLAHGLSGDAEYSERIWDILKTSMTGGKSYAGESFLNLYDFSVEEEGTAVETKFCLAEKDVLESQMVEYAKFRGLYVMMDRLDILLHRDEIQKSAEENKEASEVMEEKMDVDEANAAVDKTLGELREKIDKLNEAVEEVKEKREEYFRVLPARMEQVRIENTDTDDELSDGDKKKAKTYNEAKETFYEAVGTAQVMAYETLELATTAIDQVGKAIKNLEDFKKENGPKASGNESVAQLIDDADKNISDYEKVYLPAIQKILNDEALNRLAGDQTIGANMNGVFKNIDTAIEKYIKDIEKMRQEAEEADDESQGAGDEEELEITEYYFYYLSGSGKTTEVSTAISGKGTKNKGYKPAVMDLISYFEGKKWEKPNPTADAQGSGGSSVIDEDFASKQSEKAGEEDKSDAGGAEKGKVPDDVYNSRPSVKFVSEESGKDSGSGGFFNKDADLTASKNIVKKSQNSMLLNMGETVRDDVLCLTYMFGTFKTRLTGVNKFTAEGMSQSDKDSFYMPKWRYANEGGEVDLRFSPKKDRSTVLRSEMEYLVYGKQSDTANEAAVYATIMGERLANNVGAMYLNKKVKGACHSAAIAASAAIEFLVPETVFFWIFLTAWATAETVIEMDYLISGGYKVPLLKTKDNLLLADSPSQSGTQLISHYGKKGIFVTYEDYLLILLLLKGSDTRVMRTADLIEMNMKKNGQSDFKMTEAYTTLHADTRLSIRYLFGSVMPFQSTYEGQGFSGRIYFTDTIYQSY